MPCAAVFSWYLSVVVNAADYDLLSREWCLRRNASGTLRNVITLVRIVKPFFLKQRNNHVSVQNSVILTTLLATRTPLEKSNVVYLISGSMQVRDVQMLAKTQLS